MVRQPQSACERTKSIQKQNQARHILLFDLAHKQCNDIINGWLHFLAPESIGKFLVNNILVFNSA